MPWRGLDGLADTCTRIVRDTFKDPGGVVYTPPAGSTSYPLDAPFDDAWEDLSWSEDGLAVSSTKPMVDVRLWDLPVEPSIGGTVEVDGRTFEVEEVRRDGHASAVKLILLEL